MRATGRCRAKIGPRIPMLDEAQSPDPARRCLSKQVTGPCVFLVSLILIFAPQTHSQVSDPAVSSNPRGSLLSLPSIPEFPDLFTFDDGSKVVSPADWQRRRDELKAILLFYQYGNMPPRPDQVTVAEKERAAHASGLGTVESLTLEIDSTKKLRFRAVFYLPKVEGKRPVIIREEDRLGQQKAARLFLSRGYIFVEYARHDLDPDQDRVVGPAQAAYPDHDWATLAVWAWCGMRLLDYLETRADVDLTRIGLTGHSRGGKMALLTAALDDRIALVVPHQSGAGGAGSYRVLGPGAETLAQNDKPHWYHERIRWFGKQEERLPFDQHFLKALVAPRSLLCTESTDDEFANPLGTLATSVAAQQVYEFLDVPLKNGIHFRRGTHSTEMDDWTVLLEFAEWQFFGRAPADPRKFWSAPFSLPPRYAAPIQTVLAQTHFAIETNLFAEPPPAGAIEFRSVGEPGNPPDANLHHQGRFGAVDDLFEIAADQVSHLDYAHFLNAVASEDDPSGLYSVGMQRGPGAILRVKTPVGWRYRVRQGEPPQPVTHVSWFDALRYCNWLHNGRSSGLQDARTTEDGAYDLGDPRDTIKRRARAKFFLPTEDEWYKAAYYSPEATLHGRYQHFSPSDPNRPLITQPAPNLASPWGMRGFADQTWEWTETPVGRLHRALRSGAWFLGNNKQSAGRFYSNPEIKYPSVGFRVARPIAP